MPEALVTVPEALGSGPSHSRAAESLEKNASRSWEDLLRTVRLCGRNCWSALSPPRPRGAAKLGPANPKPGAHSGGSSWMGQGRRQREPGEARRERQPPRPCPPAIPAHPPAGEGARRGRGALSSLGCPTCRGESRRAGPMARAREHGQGSSPGPRVGLRHAACGLTSLRQTQGCKGWDPRAYTPASDMGRTREARVPSPPTPWSSAEQTRLPPGVRGVKRCAVNPAPLSSLRPGLDCSRNCQGSPRVHINPPSCYRGRGWGQETGRTTAGPRGGRVPQF